MKKFSKILTAALLTAAFSAQSVSAANIYLTMKGTADTDAIGVTLLVLNKGVALDNVTPTDIKYINQADVNADGTFSLKLPFLSQEEYDFYSNSDYTLANPENPTKTVYVSDEGLAENTGESASSPITLAKAYQNIDDTKEIILAGNTTYIEAPAHIKNLTIKADSASTVLTLASDVSLKGDITFSNLTLSGAKTVYANGYALKVDENVTSTDKLTVYGGSNGKAVSGDTNVTLLGGLYSNIYGGGNGGAVNGSTYVTVGGNVNPGNTNNDKGYCMVYGGGANATVKGKTNVTLADNAVVQYVFGAGTGANGTAVDTNINITGGKVMNVYGGSKEESTVLTDCNTHVTMTGGLAESVFGGSQKANLTGNTYVNILGGEVSRRVYSGCYNDMDIGTSGATWASAYQVIGTTTLTLAPGVKLNTKTDLSSDNQINIGVFAGSRIESHPSNEINTIIYLNDSYSSCKDYIGEKSTYTVLFIPISLSQWLKSYADYVVKAGKGGTVTGTGTAGEVYIAPDAGNYGAIGSNTYFNQNAPITADTTVTFAKEFSINGITSPTDTENGISTNVNVTAENFSNEEAPYMVVAVYEGGKLVSCDVQETPQSSANKEFNIDCKLEAGKTYIVKAMLWNKTQKPLTSAYQITVNK